MLRLFRLGLLTTLVLTIAVSTALATGRRNSIPPLISALHLTDCAPPCWIGIVPGETTLQTAKDQLIRVLYQSGFLVKFEDTAAPGLLWVNLQKPNEPIGVVQVTLHARSGNIVDSILFDFNSVRLSKQATLADFYQVFGVPERVSLPSPSIQQIDNLGLVYGSDERGMVVFASPLKAIRWDQQANVLVLFANRQLPLPRSADLRPWRGFRPIWQYYFRFR
jgi:hypothetical protein